MSETEARLIAIAVSTGDRQAFGGLVRLHQSALRLVIRRWTAGDQAWADDVAQEAFVRAYQSIMKFRNEAKFLTWLCQIAYHVFVEQGRRRQPCLTAEIDAQAAPSSAHGLNLRHDVERALAKLPEDERVAISLCFFRDLTHEEAAAVMSVPLGTLKSHVARGKAKLSEALGAWNEES